MSIILIYKNASDLAKDMDSTPIPSSFTHLRLLCVASKAYISSSLGHFTNP
jgi:hypothetical protein